MNAMKLLLCLLPVIAHAQITIKIQAKATTKSVAQATGVAENIITTDEAQVFKLTDEALKNAVLTITKREPTNVYLRGPTPWKNLYQNYNWKPVETVITPHAVKVNNVETTDVILKQREIRNDDTAVKNYDFTMTANIENKASSSWEQNDNFAANISYNIDVIALGNVPIFEINSTFGREMNERKIVTIKSGSVKFDLKPKTSAIVTISAKKVKVSVEVEYWIMLKGNVVTNNEVRLNGHHFWRYDIKNVMNAAKLPNFRKAQEIITVEFYSDDKIVVS